MVTTNLLKGAGLTATLILAGLGNAAAVPTVLAISPPGGNNNFVNGGGANNAGITFAQGYNASTPAGAVWRDAANVAVAAPVAPAPPGSVDTGDYKSPFLGNALAGTTSFFSVSPAASTGTPRILDFGGSNLQSGFSLLWGSIDNFNVMTFAGGTLAVPFVFTGADLAAAFSFSPVFTDGGNLFYEKVALVGFDFGRDTFQTVKFEASRTAFEFALRQVPEPTALALMGLGLLGAGFARRRRR